MSKVQPQPELISQLTSITSIQTKGLRKHFLEQQKGALKKKQKHKEDDTIEETQTLNSVSGSKRKRLHLTNVNVADNPIEKDPNIVGFEVVSFYWNMTKLIILTCDQCYLFCNILIC